MKTILFFNHWHNGDVFAGKGYMQDIISQLPDVKFYYAQVNSPKVILDLVCEKCHTQSIPEYVQSGENTVSVDTWIGAYKHFCMVPGQHHADWPALHKMWRTIYENINQKLGLNLQFSEDLYKYIPETNWNFFETHVVDSWVGDKSNIVLACNGNVRSGQSGISNFSEIIDRIAQFFPDYTFVCTNKFVPIAKNLYFTDDILANVKDGDINEIAYLSTKAKYIIGRNSGPYMFTHIKENINNPNITFISFSNRVSDSYAHGLPNIPCKYFHHCSNDSNLVYDRISSILTNNPVNTGLVQEI